MPALMHNGRALLSHNARSTVFGPPAACGVQSGSDFRTYQRALENVSHADVLKVTTVCSVAAFGALELCMLLARRMGIPYEVEDVECAGSATERLSCYIPFRKNGWKNSASSDCLAFIWRLANHSAHTTENGGIHGFRGLDREGRKKSHCNCLRAIPSPGKVCGSENTFARSAVYPHCDLVRDAADEATANGRALRMRVPRAHTKRHRTVSASAVAGIRKSRLADLSPSGNPTRNAERSRRAEQCWQRGRRSMRNGDEAPAGSRGGGERASIGRREIEFERNGGYASDNGIDERSIAQDGEAAALEYKAQKPGALWRLRRWKGGGTLWRQRAQRCTDSGKRQEWDARWPPGGGMWATPRSQIGHGHGDGDIRSTCLGRVLRPPTRPSLHALVSPRSPPLRAIQELRSASGRLEQEDRGVPSPYASSGKDGRWRGSTSAEDVDAHSARTQRRAANTLPLAILSQSPSLPSLLSSPQRIRAGPNRVSAADMEQEGESPLERLRRGWGIRRRRHVDGTHVCRSSVLRRGGASECSICRMYGGGLVLRNGVREEQHAHITGLGENDVPEVRGGERGQMRYPDPRGRRDFRDVRRLWWRRRTAPQSIHKMGGAQYRAEWAREKLCAGTSTE
ncbi:hypothetical protein B0H13DRAFT_1910469 [Mycena leptocephala]|nr:hypothetical protein B0H13DRAFT_1910469 [Mycena leptocephala]